MRFIDRIRKQVNRMGESMDLFKKDIFELDGVPAFREYYTLFIFAWQAVYKGFYKAWHDVPIKTLNNPKGKHRTMATMNAGKMAAAQMARYVWNERCSIRASMAGRDGDDDPLDGFLQEVLTENRFGLDIYYGALDAEKIALCHEKGITVNTWTVDDPAVAENLIAWGVDMITTNILE